MWRDLSNNSGGGLCISSTSFVYFNFFIIVYSSLRTSLKVQRTMGNNEMTAVLDHDSALQGYTGPATLWNNED